MKRIKNTWIIFAALSTGMVFSCTNLVTHEVDSTIVTTSGTGSSNADATSLLQTSYNNMGVFANQANTYSLFEHSSDEQIPPTRGTDWSDNGVWRSIYTHTWDASHSNILGAWNDLNQNSYNTNLVLAASNITPQQTAEAKFLRAFNMWHIMDLWGVVPFRNVTDGVDVNPSVKSRSEAFDFIVKDLTDALPNLPDKGPGPINEQASKASANALLARLYLNKAVYKSTNGQGPYTFDPADMTKVIQYCDAVTASGYKLDDNFFDNFKKSGGASEVIFTMITSQGTPQNRVYMTLHYDQNPSGWNGFTTLADFYGKFEDQDIRKGIPAAKDGSAFSGLAHGFLIGQQYNDNGQPITNSRESTPLVFTSDVKLAGTPTHTGIRVLKYHPADYGEYVLLRYADVYLMKAEAIMRGGTPASGETALSMVNALRTKRHASLLATVDASTMLDERGREMYWEGIRRVDLIRFEKFNDDWSEKGSNKDAFRVLYCIPQQAIDSNPNLKQNPGY